MSASPVTSMTALRAVAALTWRRAVRSRTLLVSVPLAILPLIQGVVLRVVPELSRLDSASVWRSLLVPEFLLLAVLCPLFAAASLGDEIESGTMTYLWSRPVPRWTIAAGKLLALTPLVAALLLGSAVAAMLVARGTWPPTWGLVALGVGAVTISVAATGIAMLVPKHSMVVPMAYFLFVDLPIGELPMALMRLSMTYHLRQLADGAAVSTALLWLCGLMATWAAVGLWRLKNFE